MWITVGKGSSEKGDLFAFLSLKVDVVESFIGEYYINL
jgi:hypothetical protein